MYSDSSGVERRWCVCECLVACRSQQQQQLVAAGAMTYRRVLTSCIGQCHRRASRLVVPQTGALKMLDVKMTDVKLTDQYTGHEIAGHEIAGHKRAGYETDSEAANV